MPRLVSLQPLGIELLHRKRSTARPIVNNELSGVLGTIETTGGTRGKASQGTFKLRPEVDEGEMFREVAP